MSLIKFLCQKENVIELRHNFVKDVCIGIGARIQCPILNLSLRFNMKHVKNESFTVVSFVVQDLSVLPFKFMFEF